jgi:hypothetical protein
MSDVNIMKFHSQDKNQKNPSRGYNRLVRIRMCKEKSLELRANLSRRKNQEKLVPEERPAG